MTQLTQEILEASQRFEDWYAELQNAFNTTSHSMRELVTGTNNRKLPIHKWYSLKEAYSADLPVWIKNYLIQHYTAEVNYVLDPFMGGGTTGISFAQQGIDVDGIEYNPFIHFVARTKAFYPQLKKLEVESIIRKIKLGVPRKLLSVPSLSTLSNVDYFHPSDVQTMLYVLQQIRNVNAPQEIKDFLSLGVASIIEAVSNLKKDGRALRYDAKPNRPKATEAIKQIWSEITEDLETIDFKGNFVPYRGTAVDLNSIEIVPKYDLILYSPPYLNNFDYSEIYKLELWMLKFIETKEQWQNLRRYSIRSHPSIKFNPTNHMESNPRTKDIYKQLQDMASSQALLQNRMIVVGEIIVGFFEDMYQALCEQWRVLKPGGYLVYIVANSRHKFLPVATDVILGEIAQRVGFEPLELLILKNRNGRTRQKTYLRESAVILRKPTK
jgi:DNA modification methylase